MKIVKFLMILCKLKQKHCKSISVIGKWNYLEKMIIVTSNRKFKRSLVWALFATEG